MAIFDDVLYVVIPRAVFIPSMPLERDDNGTWSLHIGDDEEVDTESTHPSYFEALPQIPDII